MTNTVIDEEKGVVSVLDKRLAIIKVLLDKKVDEVKEYLENNKVFINQLVVLGDTSIPNVSSDVRFEEKVNISGPAEMEDSVTIQGDAEFNGNAQFNGNIDCPNTMVCYSVTGDNATFFDFNATNTIKIQGVDVQEYATTTRNLIETYKSEHTAQYNTLVNDISGIKKVLSVNNVDYDTLQEIVNAIFSEENINSLVNSLANKVEKSDYESDKSTIYSTIAQNTLTAGNGIKIDKGVISIDIPNGDEVAY